MMSATIDPELHLRALRHCRVATHRALGVEVPLLIPEGVYTPDAWTDSLLAGVSRYLRACSTPMALVEVGAGSGVVPIVLDRSQPRLLVSSYVGLDIDPLAVETARINVAMNALRPVCRFLGGADLLDALGDGIGHVDVLVANIPQVPATAASERAEPSDYYPVPDDGSLDELDVRGMGLLARVVEQARPILDGGGSLITTFAGRPGLSALDLVGRRTGTRYEVLEVTRIRQDPGTSIAAFAAAEREARAEYRFYGDPSDGSPMGAREAEQLIRRGVPVYHDLYCTRVVRGSG